MPASVYAPIGIVVSVALDSSTPRRLREAMLALGVDLDKERADRDGWGRTLEIRASSDAEFSFTIENDWTDETTGVYKTVAADTDHTISVEDGHDSVWFKGTGTLTAEVYGAKMFAPA